MRPPAAMVAALAAALAVVAAIGVGRVAGSRGVVIERDGDVAAEAVDGAVGSDAHTSGGTSGSASSAGGSSSEGSAAASGSGTSGVISKVIVDIGGQVANPGVYELTGQDPRVRDAINAAGGLTAQADTASLNMAAKVADGTKIIVYAIGEAPAAAQTAGTVSGADAGSAGATAGSASGEASGGLININTATLEELQTLSGVGPSTAQRIIDERESGGAFSSVEDLMRVSGIGEKKFAKIKDSICV